MKTRTNKRLLTTACTAAAFAGATQARATVINFDKDNVKAYFSGFAELDAIYDSTQGMPEILGNNAVAKPKSITGDNPRLQFSPRNSRLAFGLMTTRGATKTKGHVEVDFFGYEPNPGSGVSEAGFYQSPTMRIRQAYGQVEHDGWSVLSGQSWSLFGWQADFVPSTVSVSPLSGTLSARTPQITGAKTFGSADQMAVTVAVSASRPVQRESATPNADAGVKFSLGGYLAPYASTNGDVKPTGLTVGLSATARSLSHPQLGSTDNRLIHKKVSAGAVDVLIPILGIHKGQAVGNTLAFVGEYTSGSGYGDMFPGWSGNIKNPVGTAATAATPTQPNVDSGVEGYNADGELVPIKLRTWTASLQYHLPQGMDSWVTLGGTQLNAVNAKNLTASTNASGATQTICDREQSAFVNVIHNFTPELRGGLEYNWLQTRYLNNVFAQNARVQVSTWYRF